MRVLDLDLDFFLKCTHVYEAKNGRHSDANVKPWYEYEVRNFLAEQCNLRGKRIPGKTVNTHNEALVFWLELIKAHKLQYPFEVVHVDAHADMELGKKNTRLYIVSYLLHLPPHERFQNINDKPNEGDYLAYALALRLISRLTYVSHDIPLDDAMWLYMKDFSTDSGFVEMKAMKNLPITLSCDSSDSLRELIISTEPAVPYSRITEVAEFSDKGDFDFIVLSKSPKYTPPSADRLLYIFDEFIEKIE